MNPQNRPLLLTVLLLTCLSFAMARTSHAGRIKVPNNDPTFTLELPAKWTYEDDKDGNLNCFPNDDSGYAFSILILPHITSMKDLKAALPELAKSMGEGAKIKKLELGDITESGKDGSDIPFAGIRGDGKTDGMDFVVMVHGFEAQKGKFYAIVTAGTKEADKKHEKDYDKITASIDPLE